MTASLHPRCSGNTCVRCRKLFNPGDRVAPVFLVTGVGRNELTREFGAFLSEEFEMAHIACHDPQLTGVIQCP
jgi:hypothetical protein